MALSKKPRPRSNGPASETATAVTEMLAENQSRAIEMVSHDDGDMRSSGGTRVMPRASKPDRLLIRASSARRRESGAFNFSEVGAAPSGVSLRDVAVAPAASSSTSWVASGAIVVVSAWRMQTSRYGEKEDGEAACRYGSSNLNRYAGFCAVQHGLREPGRADQHATDSLTLTSEVSRIVARPLQNPAKLSTLSADNPLVASDFNEVALKDTGLGPLGTAPKVVLAAYYYDILAVANHLESRFSIHESTAQAKHCFQPRRPRYGWHNLPCQNLRLMDKESGRA